MAAPRGWSREGRAYYGSDRDQVQGEDCYYCGVPGCVECGEPPRMLTQSGIIPDPDE